MNWLRHDLHCRQDAKIVALIKRYGYLAYGHYWAFVEQLAMEGGTINHEAAVEVMADVWRCSELEAADQINKFLDLGLMYEDKGDLQIRRLWVELELSEASNKQHSEAGKASGVARRQKAGLPPRDDNLNERSTDNKRPFERRSENYERATNTDLQTYRPTDLPTDQQAGTPPTPSASQPVELPDKQPRNYERLEVSLERPDPMLPWTEWCKGKGAQPIHAKRAGELLKGGVLKLQVYQEGEDGKRGKWVEQETNLDAVTREVRVELLAAAMNQVLLNERDRGNFKIVETRFAEALDKRARQKPERPRKTEAELKAEAAEVVRSQREFLAREAAQ